MNFCPNCSNILDYMKGVSESKQIIKKLNDLFKLIDSGNDENLTNYKADFDKNELLNSKKYLKYDIETKNKLNNLFSESIQLNNYAEYKCLNCGYNKPITQTIRLFYNNIEMNDNIISIKSLEENKLFCSDPLLPHTKDYVCKNINCVTHTQNDLKDSIFYKEKNLYKIKYICCVCYYNW
jgi:hypothetical protein